ncbi:MAG: hypothetical protein J6R00_04725 [Lentisphaeria bacterium]|nr:hypothetical protein [Lentisphaeria bacterium]
MRKIFENHRTFFILLGAGVILRILYLWEYSNFINFDIASGADVREYFDRAAEIISGRIFPEKPDIHGVFYPLFISPFLAVFKSIPFLRILQSALNLGAFAALYILLGKYHVPQKIRNVFFGFAALYPILFFHSSELISETLLIPLATAVMYSIYFALERKEKACFYSALAGVFCSFALLTHGAMLIFSLLCAAYLFKIKCKREAAVFLAAFIAVSGVFITAKSVHYGKFCFVQENGAFNFYLGNSEGADGTCRIRPGMQWRKLHLEAEREAEQKGVSPDRVFLSRSFNYMTDKPVSFISGFFRRAVMFFHFKELIAGADPTGLLYRTFTVRAGAFVTLFIMLSALAGAAWAVRKKLNYIPPLFWLLFISVLAVNVITVTSGRYRLAAYPSLFLFAACSTVLLPKKLTAAFAVISAAAGAFMLSGISLDHESVRILGEAAYRKGEFNKALDLLSSVKSRNDDPSGVDNMLGAIYEKRGDTANAAACYRNAIKFEPERYEAYMNLAQITPQPQAADALFREALKRANDSGLLRVNYAKFLLRCGRLQDALEMAKSGVNLLPDAPDAWNTLAVAYAYNNRIRLAADAFEGASRLDPSNMNYRRNAEIMKNELQKRLRMRQQMMLRKNNPR